MILLLLASVSFFLALIPALVFLSNLRQYLPLSLPADRETIRSLSVLIPARNEGQGMEKTLGAVLASRNVEMEVLVYDDNSEDDTPDIVQRIAQRDERVQLISGSPLPEGWAGKQHACAVLADRARYPLLVFLDADVRLDPDGLARMAVFMEQTGVALASGVPRQETGSWLEKLVIPLIHFLLLGFLPMRRMRQSTHPSYGAGCGQLFIARRDAYHQIGGHAAIRDSFHDGIKLPRAFRQAGLMTDLFDATSIAQCRMYSNSASLWNGLAKNAHEGLGSPSMIVPTSLLLLGGQVLPFLILPWSRPSPWAWFLSLVAACLAYMPRLLAAWRFRQSWFGAIFHPIGILLLVAIQWYAVVRRLLGIPVTWKGRSQARLYSEMPSSL